MAIFNAADPRPEVRGFALLIFWEKIDKLTLANAKIKTARLESMFNRARIAEKIEEEKKPELPAKKKLTRQQ